MSQERNIPYIAGPPVEQPHRFFGRQEIFEQIIDEFKYKTHTAIALYGPRRIGKTSILKQIPERLGSQYCTIQFDCQSYANKPLHQIIQSLINTMARAARMKHEYSIENHGYAIINLFRERFLPEFYAALGPERHPVLLIDEFDLLDTPAAP
ncbi:MAG TPA: ATP-binding protein, partial [Pseudomonadota bacterium]|nr:ATP-binding protein [Pseudomonadota bacterium]